jgi:hypothetical protein
MAEYFADLKKKFRQNFRKFRPGIPSFRDSLKKPNILIFKDKLNLRPDS